MARQSSLEALKITATLARTERAGSPLVFSPVNEHPPKGKGAI